MFLLYRIIGSIPSGSLPRCLLCTVISVSKDPGTNKDSSSPRKECAPFLLRAFHGRGRVGIIGVLFRLVLLRIDGVGSDGLFSFPSICPKGHLQLGFSNGCSSPLELRSWPGAVRTRRTRASRTSDAPCWCWFGNSKGTHPFQGACHENTLHLFDTFFDLKGLCISLWGDVLARVSLCRRT